MMKNGQWGASATLLFRWSIQFKWITWDKIIKSLKVALSRFTIQLRSADLRFPRYASKALLQHETAATWDKAWFITLKLMVAPRSILFINLFLPQHMTKDKLFLSRMNSKYENTHFAVFILSYVDLHVSWILRTCEYYRWWIRIGWPSFHSE